MKYKALVADDEYIIRRGILGFISKYDDFEVVAEAEDGEEAYEYAKALDIDVFFVDINMPFLNGLEFIEKLKALNPKAVVVVITGYDRFEYAREALRLGTFDYLLKPVMEEPFDKMIQEIREHLVQEKKENKYLDWAKKQLEKSREYLISDYLKGMLDGHFSDEEIAERSVYLGIDIPEDFTITVIYLDYKIGKDPNEIWTEDLLFFVAENVAGEMLNDLDNKNSCQDSYGNLVVISKRVESEEAQEQMEVYSKVLENHAPVKCMVTQKSGRGWGNISVLYLEAVSENENAKGGSAVIKDIKQFVENHYGQESFSLQDAADCAGLSVQYLSKLFKKEMGITFVDYVTSVRMRKALELMRDDELKIYEITEKTGYSTQHYFSNVFKKSMGVSPAEYRKNMKK